MGEDVDLPHAPGVLTILADCVALTKGDARRAPCLDRRHAVEEVLVDLPFEMELQLGVEIALEASTTNEGTKSAPDRHPVHHSPGTFPTQP